MNIKPLSEIVKKDIKANIEYDEYGNPICPRCKSIYITDSNGIPFDFCPDCGYKLIED